MNDATARNVARLWRFPVKSMLGESVDEAAVTCHGIFGDRGYAVIDCESGNPASAKNTRDFPHLFRFKARYTHQPEMGNELPPVEIELPDGRTRNSDDPYLNQVLSEQFGRKVQLVRSKAATPFMDANPVSVLTSATLDTMNLLQPDSIFDARRFRMNLIIETPEEGFPENEWPGCNLHCGERLELRIARPDERCIMTTLAQEDLPNDPGILKGLARHNRIKVSDTRRAPCAGVYAEVRVEGTVRVGDAVRLQRN